MADEQKQQSEISPSESKRPRRRRRWLRAIVVLLVLAVGLAVAAWIAFPHVVKWRLHATLVAAGFTEVDFDVEQVDLRSITLSDVRLGADHRFIAPRVTADFVVGEVLAGRVRTLTVYDGSWMAVINGDGSLDISPWDEISQGDDTTGDASLPFDRLALVRGTVEINRSGSAVSLPIEGNVVDELDGRVSVDLLSRYEKVRVAARGDVELSNLHTDLKVALKVAEGSSQSNQLTDLDDANADLTLDVAYAQEAADPIVIQAKGKGDSLDLSGVSRDLQMALGAYEIDGKLAVNHEGIIRSINVVAEVENLTLGETKIARVALEASRPGQNIQLALRGQYEDWQLVKIAADAPADAKAWLSPDTWFATTFEVKGTLPEALQQTLSESGVAAPGMESIHTTGKADVQFTFAKDDAAAGLNVRDGELTLPAGDVRLVDDAGEVAAQFSGVNIDLRFDGNLAADRATIAFKPGTVATVQAATTAAAQLSREQLNDDAGEALPLFDVVLIAAEADMLPGVSQPGAGGSLTVSLASTGEPGWEVTLPRLRIESQKFDAVGESFAVGDATLEAEAYVAASAGSVRAVGGVTVAMQKAGLGGSADEPAATTGAASFAITGKVAAGSGEAWSAEGSAKLQQKTGVTSGDWQAAFEQLTAEFTKQGDVIDARFNSQIVDVENADWDVSKSTLTGGVRMEGKASSGFFVVRVDAASNESLEFAATPVEVRGQIEPADDDALQLAVNISAGGLRYQGVKLPGIVGDGTWRDQKLRLTASWSNDQAGGLEADGVLDLSGERWKASAKAAMPYTELAASDPMAKLLRDLFEISVAGPVSFDLNLAAMPGSTEVSGAVNLHGVSVSGESGEGKEAMTWKVSKLVGRIELAGIDPVQTSQGQSLEWSAANFGELQLAKGSARYTLQSPTQLRISQLRQVAPDGGAIALLAPVAFDPAKPDVTASLGLENVSLDNWVEVVTLGYVTGQGKVSGKMKVRVATENGLKVALGEGSVTASPGGNFQVVDFQGAGEVVGEDVRKTLAEMDISQEIQSRIKEALSDFQFEALRFNMVRENNDTTLQIHTSGKGRNGARQEIGGLTVNIHNYNELFDVAMRTKLGLEKATANVAKKLAKPAGKGVK